jgi:hypothetical protein
MSAIESLRRGGFTAILGDRSKPGEADRLTTVVCAKMAPCQRHRLRSSTG